MRYALGAALAATVLCSVSGAALAQDRETGTLLQIEAEGVVEADPDVMSVNASVVTTGATAAEALQRNNELAARLIAAVSASNIRISRLQTSNLDVNARFAEQNNRIPDDQRPPPQILGYVATNTLDVELAEVAQAGDLISLMFEAGGNQISGPYFSLRDPKPVQRRAEQAAIAEAQAEAENFARALNMRVARVVRVFDRQFRDGDERSIVVTGSRTMPTPIEPGKVTYRATVHVEFLLEPR